VFRAEHDDTFVGWYDSEPRWKICVAFNVAPPRPEDDVLYFMATSQVTLYRENPVLMGDALEFPRDSYPFFTKDTIVNFREVYAAPLSKLKQHGLRVEGTLSAVDVARCEEAARTAMQLLNKSKRRLGLL
jgi:hypothetical protein